MKSFRTLVSEVAHNPKPDEERRFVNQHVVEVMPHPVAPESQFKGTIEKKKRLADNDSKSSETSYDMAYTMKEDAGGEADMMIRQLYFIQYATEEIIDFLEAGNEVETWYQNKLAVIFDKMQSLHAYAEGEKLMGDDEFEYDNYDMAYEDVGFAKVAQSIVAKEIKIAKEEDFPDLAQRVAKLNKLAKITDRDKFVKMYKSITGAEDGDLPEELYESCEELVESYKAGSMKLKNGDTVKVSAQDAKLLNQMLDDLDSKNRKNFEDILTTDKAGFDEIIGFAREAV